MCILCTCTDHGLEELLESAGYSVHDLAGVTFPRNVEQEFGVVVLLDSDLKPVPLQNLVSASGQVDQVVHHCSGDNCLPISSQTQLQ